MSTNYIELYRSDNVLTAKIHKNGKVLTTKNQNIIKELLRICHKHNQMFKGKRILDENVDPIIKDFDKYYSSIKKRNQRLKVIGQVLDNMELKAKSIATGPITVTDNIKETIDKMKRVKLTPMGKIVVTTTLAATIGITSFGILSNKKTSTKLEPINNQVVLEENFEYIPEDINTLEADLVTPTPVTLENVSLEVTPEEVITPTPEPEVVENNELEEMLQSEEFHFSYEDRSNYENVTNAKRYQDIFERYANRYGVDVNLLIAIASQENCGKHYEALHSTYANGIMQIENVNINTTISAYNFETGQIDNVYITQEGVEDLETNIQIGTMFIRNTLETYNYNIPLAIQGYNFGYGNMSRSIAMCSDLENISREEVKENITNAPWMNYRQFLGVGDPQYVEHIFSFIPNNTVINVLDRDGNNHSIQIVNDYQNVNQLT